MSTEPAYVFTESDTTTWGGQVCRGRWELTPLPDGSIDAQNWSGANLAATETLHPAP